MIKTSIYVQVFCIFAQNLGVQGIQEDFIDFYFEMQIGCINVIYLCQRIEILIKNDMKKAQVEYNSKGKNGSWDANRLVRE